MQPFKQLVYPATLAVREDGRVVNDVGLELVQTSRDGQHHVTRQSMVSGLKPVLHAVRQHGWRKLEQSPTCGGIR